MPSLCHIQKDDFKRILDSDLEPIKKARIFSVFARINTLYMIAKAGSGHIGSSFSSMEIFVWLYLNVMSESDVFFSSKGHDAPGLYAVLTGLGIIDFEKLHELRRLGGLPGHPDIETKGIVANTGSLGMGISKAKGMALANQLDDKPGRIYMLAGDGELQEGQFWEALPGAVNRKLDQITVIIDHNKIQSDTWIKDVSDLGNLESKFESYGWHFQRCDGNNLESLEKAVNVAKEIKDKPQVILADTVKGCGVSFMQATSLPEGEKFYKFHSGAPSQEDYDLAVKELIEKANELLSEVNMPPFKISTFERESVGSPKDKVHKLIPAYEKALLEIGARHKDVVVQDADLMIDCGLMSFKDSYPERFFECGIAEQDMVSQAGALALKGKLPISHSFACFLAPRANEQIYNNASEMSKCIYVGSLAGLLPAGPGHSHQSVRDISALGGVPGLLLLEPCCEQEVAMVLDYAVDMNPNSTYIRLISIPYEVPFELPNDYSLKEGEGVCLTEGEDAIIFAYGMVMVSEAYKAANLLEKNHGFSLKVVNLPWLNKVSPEWLETTIGSIKKVFTLDNHLLRGGQGEMIGSTIASLTFSNSNDFFQFGLKEIPKCGQNKEILLYYGMDSGSLESQILKASG